MGDASVLIAVLPEVKDWGILQRELWYRIPVSSAPAIIKNRSAKYIAFYHTSKFGTDLKWSIRYYGKIKAISVVSRHDLFPQESPHHSKAKNMYYKVEIESLLTLEQPFISRRGHRLVFVPTTATKFFSGRSDLNVLFNSSPLEDDMLNILDLMGVEYEREWVEYALDNVLYRLDFVIFCHKGKINIECDGDEFHTGTDHVHYDKTRNNNLESYGWAVMRYTSKHFKEERQHIESTLYKKIVDLGGVQKIAEPKIAYYPNRGNSGQLDLF